MSRNYCLLNKISLKDIIEYTNVTYDYIHKITGFDEIQIKQWINAEEIIRPTINQAKVLAKCLQIPFAGLYLSPEHIPKTQLPHLRNMRTIYGSFSFDDSALNIAIIKLARLREFIIQTTKELENNLEIFDLSFTENSSQKLAYFIRNAFNIDIKMQFKCDSKRKFYIYLRNQIENKGIIVNCFPNVDIECARGISIFYNEYPIIGINENDSYSAKSFTIIHELVHILKRSSNFCNDTYNSFSYNSEEVFCNAVAGEVLVPIEYLLKENSLLYKNYIDDNIISILSNKYCVSKEVILRRLLDNNYIHKPDYDEFILKFKVEVEKEKAQQRLDIEIKKEKYGYSGIPRNIGRETYDKNGLTFSNLLYDGYANELFSKKDIAGYLGIKQKHIVNFFKEVSKY